MNGAIIHRGEVEKCVPVTDRGERRGFMMVRLTLGALLFVALASSYSILLRP